MMATRMHALYGASITYSLFAMSVCLALAVFSCDCLRVCVFVSCSDAISIAFFASLAGYRTLSRPAHFVGSWFLGSTHFVQLGDRNALTPSQWSLEWMCKCARAVLLILFTLKNANGNKLKRNNFRFEFSLFVFFSFIQRYSKTHQSFAAFTAAVLVTFAQ